MAARIIDLESDADGVDATALRAVSCARVHNSKAKRKWDMLAPEVRRCEENACPRAAYAASASLQDALRDTAVTNALTSRAQKVPKVDAVCASDNARRPESSPSFQLCVASGAGSAHTRTRHGQRSAPEERGRWRDARACRPRMIDLSDSGDDGVSEPRSSCTDGCARAARGRKDVAHEGVREEKAKNSGGVLLIACGDTCGSLRDGIGDTCGSMCDGIGVKMDVNGCMNSAKLALDGAREECFEGKSANTTVLLDDGKVEYNEWGEGHRKVVSPDDVNVDENDHYRVVLPDDVKVEDDNDHFKLALSDIVKVEDENDCLKAMLLDDVKVDENDHFKGVLPDDVKVEDENDRLKALFPDDIRAQPAQKCTKAILRDRCAKGELGKKHVKRILRDDAKDEERVPKVIDLSDEEEVAFWDDALVSKQLSAWYLRNRRRLPWHGSPWYGVWVSEVMLQQTQVAKVIPYWERWMQKWPTVHSLAGAREEDVFEVWMGLGYYRRAKSLLMAAKNLHKDPTCAKDLRELHGVGRYTANAVASICFGEKVPVVDCNVQRVLRRCFADFETSRNATPEWLWTRMEGVLGDQPGIVNQAVMELGATHCSIKLPNCNACPIKDFCRANGDPEVQKRATSCRNNGKTKPCESMDLFVIRTKDQVAVTKFGRGLLSGQWMFPTAEACSQAFGPAFAKYAEASELRGTVRHAFSHRTHEYRVFVFTLEDEANLVDGSPITFTDEKQLLPRLTTGQKKVLAVAST